MVLVCVGNIVVVRKSECYMSVACTSSKLSQDKLHEGLRAHIISYLEMGFNEKKINGLNQWVQLRQTGL